MTEEPSMSADDVRQQMQRMRALPVDEVIGEVVFMLLNAAQVKLGRRDARLLIDLSAVVQEHARPYLPDDLTRQLDQVLGQLRMGQVSAEGHPTPLAEREQNDLDRIPAPPPAGTAPPSAGPATPAADRASSDEP